MSEATEEFAPYIVGYRPFTSSETQGAIIGLIVDRIESMQEESRLESLKGAANDTKIEAYRWATESLLQDIIGVISAVEFHEAIFMVEPGVIEVYGERVPVQTMFQDPPVTFEYSVEKPDGDLGQLVSEVSADPNRLAPEFVGEPNEKVMLDNIAQTVTPLDNPKAQKAEAKKSFVPEFDVAPTAEDSSI